MIACLLLVPDDEIHGEYMVKTLSPSLPLPFTPIGLALDHINHIMYVTSDSNQIYALICTPSLDAITNIVSIAGAPDEGSNDGVGTLARLVQDIPHRIHITSTSNSFS